ncbi:type i secretion target ggxgxdxxx repeat protein domain protein [Leptolyngbya sp. Heron Island J]|uniref:calcium-binding protein n=1 Tax=Leptolyngbya sp. Heron Island J TaxID=1385935 RepID=UPI0003B9C0C8|nr:type i secretion target ggxgxdxxx repeat protein domain protein [Leptolyngbya sp. Heron Island J]ESA35639.1 type i secretion target ggxgxdxxx repeat protein domain protein [Leptolyngbya sp. Heron Island J]
MKENNFASSLDSEFSLSTVPNHPTVVVLFRGGGETESRGFLGSESGMDLLSQGLNEKFVQDTSEPFYSQVFAEFQLKEAFQYVKSFQEPIKLVLVGYSFGANTVIELAQKISSQPVELLVQIDAVPRPALAQLIDVRQTVELFGAQFEQFGFFEIPGFREIIESQDFLEYRFVAELLAQQAQQVEGTLEDSLNGRLLQQALVDAGLLEYVEIDHLPENVVTGVNYFQTASQQFEPEGVRDVKGSININLETIELESESPSFISHANIDEISFLQNLLVSQVSEVARKSDQEVESPIIGDFKDNFLLGNRSENLIAGGLGNDFLFGGDGNDVLRGDLNRRSPQNTINGGDDILYGGRGNDRIGGKSGNDQLYGGEGNDRLWGDLGDDILVGGQGEDILYGSAGADVFRFNSPEEGPDTIVDFDQLQGDRLEILGSSFADDLMPGELSAAAFVLGSSAVIASDRLIYNQSTGSLFFDADGSGSQAALQVATLSNNANLTYADIVVV